VTSRVDTIRALAAGMACAAALAAAGCGGDDEPKPIPSDAAQVLQQDLNAVESQLAADATCDQIESETFARIEQDLGQVPAGEVRDALQQSFDRLLTLVQGQCEQQTTPTETTPTETTPPPETTETQETQTQETETQTEPQKPKEDQKDNQGNGNGNSGGNGNGQGSGGALAPDGSIRPPGAEG
jgi:hypothetical protein